MPRFVDQIKTVADDPGPWSIYIYGEPGSRKTVMAAGAKNCLIIDTERSRRALLNHPELTKVPIFPCSDYKEIEKLAYEMGRNDTDFGHIETVIIDTITTLQMKEKREQMIAVHKANNQRNVDLPSEAEHNISNSRMRSLVLAFQEYSNKNLILLGHVKEEKDNEGTTIVIRPGTTPSLTDSLVAIVDAVFYMSCVADSNGNVKHTMKTAATRKLKAKNRFGSLPAEILNPTMRMIEEAADKQRETALQLIKEKQDNGQG